MSIGKTTQQSRISDSARTWRVSKLRFCSKVILGFTASVILALAVCAGAPTERSLDPDSDALKPAVADPDYKISPTDIINISVFQEADLRSTLRVSNKGTIDFPLIGIVPIAGLSAQEAARSLEKRLAPGYLINPQVTVTVMEFSKRRFTVLGEVQKPGSYDMPDQDDVTVLQAIGMAGGYTRIANPRSVTLMRKSESKQQVFQLNAKRMASGNAEPVFRVVPGDVITVAESVF